MYLALWDLGNLIGPFTTQVSHLSNNNCFIVMRVIYGENLTECLAIGMLTCSQLLSPFKQTGSPSYGQNILRQRSILRSCLLHLFSRFWANHSTSVNQSFLNQGESFHFLTFPYRSAPKRPHLQVKPHHHFSDSILNALFGFGEPPPHNWHPTRQSPFPSVEVENTNTYFPSLPCTKGSDIWPGCYQPNTYNLLLRCGLWHYRMGTTPP